MRRAFNAFMFDRMDAPLLDGTGLQPDPELAARNQQRVQKIIAAMGAKWCCFSMRQAEDEMQTLAAHSHTEGR